MQVADGVSQELAIFGDVMLARGGIIRRTGEGEHAALASRIDQNGGADWRLGTHRPGGAFPTLRLASGAIGLEQFSYGLGGGRLKNAGGTLHQERPVHAA